MGYRSDFGRVYLVIEGIPALVMFGFEYAVHADMIPVIQGRMTPYEDVDRAASAWILQLECSVVVAPV